MTLKTKPQLVLDMAGVLVTNLSSAFWSELEAASGAEVYSVRTQFHAIRKDVWTGRIGEAQFWVWLTGQYPQIDTVRAKEILMRSIQPLLAAQHLERWSQIADIHVLSNHCREWLEPVLAAIEPYATSITISNQVGLCKPDVQIYEAVRRQMADTDRILYVDDQEKNLLPAASLGWDTLLADEQNKWVQEVELRLTAS